MLKILHFFQSIPTCLLEYFNDICSEVLLDNFNTCIIFAFLSAHCLFPVEIYLVLDMINPIPKKGNAILKSRDITLPTKVRLVKAMVFPVVIYGHESWTVKKAEHRKMDAFELWCWRRLLRVPWTARRSNQSILNEVSPGCSLEGLMLKLKLQCFSHLMGRVDSLEKTLMLGRIGGRRRRETEDEMAKWHHQLNGHWFE